MSQRTYPGYKLSGIDWIGDIPESWNVVPLWWLFQRSKRLGTGNEELLSVYRDYGVIPKSSRDDNFNKASEDLSKYQVVETGDLVINKMKAWQGSVAISDYDGIVSPAYFVFKHLEAMNLRFMHYLMRSVPYFQHYASISTGVRPNQWDLDPGRHRVMGVLFPSHAEQQSIADFLDRETAEIDAFISDQEELIVLLNERRAATITQAVTKGLDPTVPMKDSGVHWLGSVPSQWSVRGIKASAAMIGGSGFPHEYQGLEDEEIPFHKVSALAGAGPDGIIRNSKDTVSRATVKVLGAKILPTGTIVMAKIGAALLLGRMRSVDRPFCIDNNMLGLVPQEGYVTKYLIYALQIVSFDLIVNPGAVPSLDMTAFRDYALAFPGHAEQQTIAEYLDRETGEIDATIADAREAIALSKERRSSLISAAVTGKIDVREAMTVKRKMLKEDSVDVA